VIYSRTFCLCYIAEFTFLLIDLAPFAEGEDPHQKLVDLFLHTAYPRSPTTVPPNEPWKASVYTGEL
jgi:hypothetical protein